VPSDGVRSETYTYDRLGRMTQFSKVISSTTYTTTYAYNLGNELTSVTYPSGRVVAQNYDSLGRLCSVGASGSGCSSGTRYADSFAYNTAQQVTAFNFGNGVAASFGYSADRLQMISLSYAKSGTTLFGLNYYYKYDSSNCSTGTLGNNRQIQCTSDTVDSGRTVKYTYDALARLSTAQTNGSTPYPQWGLSEAYDRYGNRTAQTVTAGTGPSNSVSVSATTNRLTGSPYTYDSNGNMTADGANSTMVFDAENRLVSINNGAATYTYDGNSLRVKKVSGSTTTVYIFSGSKVIAEYDNGAAYNSPTREYLYAGSQLLARIDGSTTKYYHQDHLSNRLTTDSIGTALEQKGHFPFGEDWYQGSDKLKFTTYERDSESGNDFAMARYHVNRLGRFASPDPLAGSLGNPQSINRYAYAMNLPVSLADPLGLAPCGDPENGPSHPCPAMIEGGDPSGFGCSLDGISVGCSWVSRQTFYEVGAQCPDNVCSGFGTNSNGDVRFVQFMSFAGGANGYFYGPDLGNGINEFNGHLYNNANWNELVQMTFADKIEVQREALARKIAANSNISYADALKSLQTGSGYVQGGNWNFTTSLTPPALACGTDASRCNGIHFVQHNGQQYVHLDTSNPFGGVFSFLAHSVVDVVAGNTVWWVIPRH
jgi:RHS repeat-associated protein